MSEADRFWEEATSWQALVERCRALIQDVGFPTVRAWKEQRPEAKAIACFPVYTPQELIAASGALPVTLFGGRGQIEIDHADSHIQSFVCSIARSTLELGLAGHLGWLDGIVFPSICDVARNLSGVWQHNFPDTRVFYLHLPQNVESAAAAAYYRTELGRLRDYLAEAIGQEVLDESLRSSIRCTNRNRTLLGEFAERRATEPERWPLSHLYALAGAGNVLSREEHNRLLERALELGETNSSPKRDLVRVALRGAFCEQPPLELLDVLEETGCAVVDDDFEIAARFFTGPVPENGDPLAALAGAYLERAVLSPVKHPGRRSRSDGLLGLCGEKNIQGVIFASPKFCEPALYDSVLSKHALERAGIPSLEFEYEEKMTVFESVRTQAETFVESILFFS